MKMKSVLKISTQTFMLGSVLCTVPVITYAQSMPTSGSPQQATEPDNTKQNKQEMPTADQQTNNAADLDMAKNVRRALMQDKSLSTYAHNVKIIAQNGKVTLKGPVKTEDEKQAIAAKAAEVAGAGNVVDELTVTPK
jgi:hyperosmotically inducible periplasmic protein